MALARPRTTPRRGSDTIPKIADFPVLTAVKIWKGSLVVLASGNAKPGVTGTGLIAIGRATRTVDNTNGASGDLRVEVDQGCFRWANSAAADLIAADDVGKLCYVVDDQTVALTSDTGARSIAGMIFDVDASGVWVISGLMPQDAAALAAEIVSREAITTDLAATTNGLGASLVGIEDAGTLYAATDVEAALAEKLNGTRVANVATANVIGGVPVVHMTTLTSGANGDTDIVLTHKTRVIKAWAVMKGAGTAGCLITIKNLATAITDALDVAAAGDRDLVDFLEIDDAQHEIAAAGTLRVSKASTGADFPGAIVYTMGIRVA